MEIESYITGFVDGEGCFSVSFSKRKKMKFGIEVRPSFSISQHRRNREIILEIQKFFGCGGVRFSKRDQNYKFEVRSVNDLVNKVIPHFENYPLQTTKKNDFLLFKEVCLLIYSNHHLNKDGLKKIIELSEKINKTGKKKYERESLLKLVAG
jgi:hypothetical protein